MQCNVYDPPPNGKQGLRTFRSLKFCLDTSRKTRTSKDKPRMCMEDQSETNLIISLDLGTAFSGASWVLLGNPQVPYIWDVSEFREDLPAKVPTVLYYDDQGTLQAAGSRVLDRDIIDKAKNNGWIRVEWFKLLLRPDSLAHEQGNGLQTEMPRNKKLIHVISDFFRYMASLARKHFQETMDAEGKIWEEVKDRVKYILSYTNGWNTFQHQLIREAAILAGLVPDSDIGKNRIIFVSEGEASLHWCIKRRVAIRDLKVDSHFIIVDAGAGTIDISSFKTLDTAPLKFEESSIPECHLKGSAFVTEAFRRWVQDKLKDSSFKDPDIIQLMVRDFDREVKTRFRDLTQDMFVKFGGSQDNDPTFDITAGHLLVRGQEMATFFEPACRAIVDSVKTKIAQILPQSKTSVLLVGGFSVNEYLFKEVQRRLTGTLVFRPSDTMVKASANGVICFHLERTVVARMAKGTYGVSCVHNFDLGDSKHAQRISRVKTNEFSGQQFIEGGFFVTLEKGTVVQETEFTRFPFWHSQPTRTPTTLNIRLECYRGDVRDIKFRDEDGDSEDKFRELCWFKAVIPETSLVRRKAKKVKSKNRASGASAKYYYVSNFYIVVSFGATEFKCYIEWMDKKGNTQRGPITPFWNEG